MQVIDQYIDRKLEFLLHLDVIKKGITLLTCNQRQELESAYRRGCSCIYFCVVRKYLYIFV